MAHIKVNIHQIDFLVEFMNINHHKVYGNNWFNQYKFFYVN